jgi:hypothetical protein
LSIAGRVSRAYAETNPRTRLRWRVQSTALKLGLEAGPQVAGKPGSHVSKFWWVDQRTDCGCSVSFRQQQTCRGTRPVPRWAQPASRAAQRFCFQSVRLSTHRSPRLFEHQLAKSRIIRPRSPLFLGDASRLIMPPHISKIIRLPNPTLEHGWTASSGPGTNQRIASDGGPAMHPPRPFEPESQSAQKSSTI